MAKQKQRFQCHKCQETFDLLIDSEEQPVLMGYCPYCGETWEVDLLPEASTVTIYKSPTQKIAESMQLPAVLITRPRQE
ncbi:hypothetical protein BegalDRAFT_0890 [Beggiatoa alba B18LD]|uniref:Uncharacterized protein n=1 Tax=Beggiatoa alba B18LD TaxID=395493 RepID=I3CDV5_9GAMM|nr:hypothetical protein [Beggiatoa alba]EIJ41798.1 hypothetical protein BegalDRAFT_0890 [Beggiatoa alba B18LD]